MMTRDFVYWLQGFFEISNASELNEHQVQVIKEHLALVLSKETVTNPIKFGQPSILWNDPNINFGGGMISYPHGVPASC